MTLESFKQPSTLYTVNIVMGSSLSFQNQKQNFALPMIIGAEKAALCTWSSNHIIRSFSIAPLRPFSNFCYYSCLQLSRPFFFLWFIHMCIQCLGHFSPLPQPHAFPHPRFQAETVLPLSLILLKREYKQ
jgi:hypothetical protein